MRHDLHLVGHAYRLRPVDEQDADFIKDKAKATVIKRARLVPAEATPLPAAPKSTEERKPATPPSGK